MKWFKKLIESQNQAEIVLARRKEVRKEINDKKDRLELLRRYHLHLNDDEVPKELGVELGFPQGKISGFRRWRTGSKVKDEIKRLERSIEGLEWLASKIDQKVMEFDREKSGE